MDQGRARAGFTQSLDALTAKVIGAAIDVHRVLGPGFPEAVYEEALCVELADRGVPFVRQAGVPIVYKGHPVGHGRIDVLVDNQLVVELKVSANAPLHVAQVHSYLKATGLRLGLLFNFNVTTLRQGIQRVVLSRDGASSPA
jgi:GxxExxY protein